MTGSVSYTSLDEFELDYKEALYAEVAELAQEHTWWNEPLQLCEHKKSPYLLTGSSSIMRRYITKPDGSQVNVSYRDDILLGVVDYLTIVEMLTYLSKEHEFAWTLGIPGEPRDKPIGKIDNGEIDPAIFEFISEELDALDITENELADEALHRKIRAKYFA